MIRILLQANAVTVVVLHCSNIYSRLSRCRTVRAPAPRFVQRCPAKVGACKSVLFTESSRVVKISQIVGVGEVCDQNGDC